MFCGSLLFIDLSSDVAKSWEEGMDKLVAEIRRLQGMWNGCVRAGVRIRGIGVRIRGRG